MWWMVPAWAEPTKPQSELEAKIRVEPKFPESMKETHTEDVRCLVQVFIAEDGVPFEATPDCPEPYASAAKEALLQWRWYPPRYDGAPIRARTTVAVTFRLEREASFPVRGVFGLGAGSSGGAGAFAAHTRLAGYDGLYAELRVDSALQEPSLAQGYFRNDLALGPGRWWGPVALGAFVGLGFDSAFRFWPDVLRVSGGVAAAVEPHPMLCAEVTARTSLVAAGPEALREPLPPLHEADLSLDLWILPFERDTSRFGVALGGHHLARAVGPLTTGWIGFAMAPVRQE